MNQEMFNAEIEPFYVGLQARTGVSPYIPQIAPVTGAVHSLAGLLGPDILLATGAANKGLAVSQVPAGSTITFSITGVTTAVKESGGQVLDLAGVADGKYLKRSGTTIVGDTPAGGGSTGMSIFDAWSL